MLKQKRKPKQSVSIFDMENIKLRKILFILFSLIVTFSSSFAGNLLWTVNSKDDVKWVKTTPMGTVIFASEKGIYAVDPNTGDYIWKKEDIEKIKDYQVLLNPLKPIMIIGKVKVREERMSLTSHQKIGSRRGYESLELIAINIKDGTEAWRTEEMFGMVVGDFYKYLDDELILFLNDKKNKPSLYVYDITSGELKLKKEPFYKDNFEKFRIEGLYYYNLGLGQYPVFEENTAYMAFPKPCKVDLKTGEILWWCQNTSVKKTARRRGMAQMVADETTLYVPNDKELYAIDKADGRVKWISKMRNKIRFWIGIDGNIIYVMGLNYINALYRSDGRIIWKQPFKFKKVFLLPHAKGLFFAADGKLFNIDKEKGSIIYEIELKDFNEAVRSIEIRESGVVLKGTQQVCLIDTVSRTIKWHTSLEAVGPSGLTKFATIALATSLLISFAYMHSTFINPPFYITRTGDWLQSIPVYAGVIASVSNLVTSRYSTDQVGQNHIYILTKVKGETGIAAVNLDTGKVTSEVVLENRNPKCLVDVLGFKVFEINGKKIMGYSF